jgi:lysophospholipase L1-like esterase
VRRWVERLFAAIAATGLVAAIAGCRTLPEATAMPTPAAATASLSYLALGDSYTIGEGVDAPARWPHQLAAALRADGIALQDPRTIARTGWTTDELSSAIDDAGSLGEFDFVSLLIGVNNQYRGRAVENYREEFAALLDRAIAFAGGHADRVLVLSIPDWGATRFGAGSGRDLAQIARELDAYNAAAREISVARGVAFVDITPVSRARGNEDAMLAEDGLHPSAAMYAEWARGALPVARALLSDTGEHAR